MHMPDRISLGENLADSEKATVMQQPATLAGDQTCVDGVREALDLNPPGLRNYRACRHAARLRFRVVVMVTDMPSCVSMSTRVSRLKRPILPVRR